MKKTANNLSEFKEILLLQVLPLIRPGTILLLAGPMGAGKTEAVKFLCQQLKVKEAVSPSFGLQQFYQGSLDGQSLTIQHWDLYRLKEGDEFSSDLESTGFWDQITDPNAIIFVEWGDRLKIQDLPKGMNVIPLDIMIQTSGQRILIVNKH